MGGRGASIPSATPGGGGGGASAGLDAMPGNPATLEEALGKQGRPMSVSRAILGANPYYDSKYGEYSMNCQRCVSATEARFRGYDVIASPTFDGDTMPTSGQWATAFKGAKIENVGRTTANATQKSLEQKMQSYGDGSRAVMSVQWKGRNAGGHVLNVIQKNGKTYYYDGQVGKTYSGKDLFKAIKPQSAKITRVDNLDFANDARKAFRQKPKK